MYIFQMIYMCALWHVVRSLLQTNQVTVTSYKKAVDIYIHVAFEMQCKLPVSAYLVQVDIPNIFTTNRKP